MLKAFNTQHKISTLPTKSHYPPNKKSEIQPRFFSTKAKRGKSTTVLCKPNVGQAKERYTDLQETETELCGICLQQEDSLYTNSDNILWVSCNKCSLWVHASCSNVTNTDCDIHVCPYCASHTMFKPQRLHMVNQMRLVT